MNNKNVSPSVKGNFPWVVMILMSFVTFVGILSELMPSGVLPQMMVDLNITEVQAGNLVGYYAIASAIFAIPLISLTMQFDRKVLLLILLVGFAISNIIVGMVEDYGLIIALRVIGGICAGVMWPMISAYGMRLVPDHQHGRAVAVIMAGNTLGISIGMPLFTYIGLTYGWRTEFITLGAIIVLIVIINIFVLPATPGEKLTPSTSPFALLKIPSVLIILLLTVLGVSAHYGVYVYITSLVDEINLPGGIEMALILFGVGSICSVWLAVKYTDRYLRFLTVAMFALQAFAMGLLLLFVNIPGIPHVSFLIWGLSFGPLVTLFSTAVSKQVDRAKDVATSLQSCMFNLSIMIATAVAGVLLGSYTAMSLPAFAIFLAVPGMLISYSAKRTLT